METRQGERAGAAWLAVLGVVLVAVVAVLVDAPSAAFLLAGLCVVLAVIRGTGRHEPAAFRARARSFDVAVLVVAAVALAVLAPAGYLT